MLTGKQTWVFPTPPKLISGAAIGGRREGEGPLAADFDKIYPNAWLDKDTFEQAEQAFLQETVQTAVNKAGITLNDVDLFFAGDLINQITSSSFTARQLAVPYIGLFGACSTSMASLAMASLAVSAGFAQHAVAGTVSHYNTAEKQFRNPNEYGCQKPPTAQWTVTASGAGVVAPASGPGVVNITAATIGKVVDLGCTDPFDMGSAMAPAAADTIQRHLEDRGVTPDYYDFIFTGDLGRVGREIALTLLHQRGVQLDPDKFADCGLLIYAKEQKVFSGGSGCGCSASVAYGHLYKMLLEGRLNRILVVATGALMSPLTYQQMESIPGIAHGVALERS